MVQDADGPAKLATLVFSLLERQEHMHELGNRLLEESAAHLHARPLRTQARIGSDKRSVRFLAAYSSPLILPGWEFLLGDFLYNARSLLDNIAWLCSHLDPAISYTESEERGIFFPICHSAEAWDKNLNKKHFQAMEPVFIERMRLCQPFVYDEPSPGILDWLHDLNRFDKHRTRARLQVGIDPQWPLTFDLFNGQDRVSPSESSIVWSPLPNLPDTFEEIVSLQAQNEVARALPLRVYWALFVGGEGGAKLWDIQDFVWDVLLRVQRIQEIVIDGEPSKSEQALAEMTRSRERSRALKRSIEEGTGEFEQFLHDPPTKHLQQQRRDKA